MNMIIRDDLNQTLEKLKTVPHVDQNILNEFRNWFNLSDKLLRGQGTKHHICAMFAPYDSKRNEVFLINHRKANMWMIPGGHVEPNETLIESLQREYLEELGKDLDPRTLELFDLTITLITTRPDCKTHYDLWYIAHVAKQNFVIEQAAFSDSGWFPLNEALKMVTHPGFNRLLSKFKPT